jgi:hypothetical protein
VKKSEILIFLDRYNFNVDKSEIFIKEHEEFVYCYREKNNVGFIIKEYNDYTNAQIMEDVIKIRTILRQQNINIWNSYYIILINSASISNEIGSKIYNIERNSKGLRKYVVLDESDLFRIPFIKHEDPNTTSLNFISDFNQVLYTEDNDVRELIQWVIESEGEFVELKKPVLKEKINEIFLWGMNHNENK